MTVLLALCSIFCGVQQLPQQKQEKQNDYSGKALFVEQTYPMKAKIHCDQASSAAVGYERANERRNLQRKIEFLKDLYYETAIKIAKSLNASSVVLSRNIGTSRMSEILWLNPATNITQQVIDEIDEKYQTCDDIK